ncbi:hypothetical protein NLG97_g3706 [Lecanicillium saksenae]|uniref:Uncharacterized protein n=1 Tax=Lecanicillium saksenae TaxID=468837 RepID=A0ACC1R1A7_9HYPO|nr:hypothetical protein NLG97_g3706 [Lecanicillium saksenae]
MMTHDRLRPTPPKARQLLRWAHPAFSRLPEPPPPCTIQTAVLVRGCVADFAHGSTPRKPDILRWNPAGTTRAIRYLVDKRTALAASVAPAPARILAVGDDYQQWAMLPGQQREDNITSIFFSRQRNVAGVQPMRQFTMVATQASGKAAAVVYPLAFLCIAILSFPRPPCSLRQFIHAGETIGPSKEIPPPKLQPTQKSTTRPHPDNQLPRQKPVSFADVTKAAAQQAPGDVRVAPIRRQPIAASNYPDRRILLRLKEGCSFFEKSSFQIRLALKDKLALDTKDIQDIKRTNTGWALLTRNEEI